MGTFVLIRSTQTFYERINVGYSADLYPNESFDFLGYTFRARRSKNRWGEYFVNFSPAVSNQATLGFSLAIEATGSQVPHKSLGPGHATFMPDAAWPVNRFLPGFSWANNSLPVLTSSLPFRHVISGSLPLVSLTLT